MKRLLSFAVLALVGGILLISPFVPMAMAKHSGHHRHARRAQHHHHRHRYGHI